MTRTVGSSSFPAPVHQGHIYQFTTELVLLATLAYRTWAWSLQEVSSPSSSFRMNVQTARLARNQKMLLLVQSSGQPGPGIDSPPETQCSRHK